MLAELILAASLILTPAPEEAPPAPVWSGPVLTAEMGCNLYGPNGAETWYNMPMDAFFSFIYDLGFSGTPYVGANGVWYWSNADGDFVVVGAYLPKYPRGTYVQTSLGPGIVLDTGFFYYGEDQFDIATTWSI